MTLRSTGDSVVRIGSRVRVRDDEGEAEIAVVSAEDADAIADRISEDSPLGRALLGRRVGELVKYRAPAGTMRVSVVAVE